MRVPIHAAGTTGLMITPRPGDVVGMAIPGSGNPCSPVFEEGTS